MLIQNLPIQFKSMFQKLYSPKRVWIKGILLPFKNYLKPKYSENAKLCYMDTGSFIVHVKSEDIYKDKEVIGFMKDKLGGQIMKEFAGLRAKAYSYLKDHNDEDKKEKDTQKCVIKRKLRFQDYKNCLEAPQTENKPFRKK